MSAVPTTGTLRQRQPPLRDRRHLDAFRDLGCVICNDPAIGAHFRSGLGGGTSMKPGDDLTIPLCPRHHDEQTVSKLGELGWWLDYLSTNKPLLVRVMRAFARSFYVRMP